jgi:16S rRNA (cytosine967-C5)-methyltransferase
VTVGPRELAIEVLVRVEDGAFANVLLPARLRATDLDARARAQATDLVYGTLRRRRALDALIDRVVDRPLQQLDPPVRAALRLGTYELVEGVPAHAAVGETVTAVGRSAARAKGFVNAVLRRVADLGPDWPWPQGDATEAVAIRTSMPDWIVERLVTDLGRDDALAVLDAENRPAPLTLRVDAHRADPDAVAAELQAAGATVERGQLVPGALLVRGAGDPSRIAAVADGRATPQDQASQAVATAVGARAGERVLEVGAAPGGKTTALAAAMDDTGLVAAVDLQAARLGLVARAVDRLGLSSVAPVVADGRALPFAPASFDRELLDAPCSGLGVLRRRPEARWRIEPEAVDELAGLQRELLATTAKMVGPGGRLVYSVCTLSRAETTDVDEWAQAQLPDLTAEPPPGDPWQPWGRGALLLPSVADTDGMYVLVLRRTDPAR